MQSERASRRWTFASSAVALTINLAVLLFIQLLPASSCHVSNHVSLYAAYSALMAGAGLLGAYKRDPALISVFANHLLLDAAVFTAPRVLLLAYAATAPYNLCSSSARDFRTGQPAPAPGRAERVEAWAARLAGLGHGPCLAVSSALVATVALAVLGLTLAQWVAAVQVRRYGLRVAHADGGDAVASPEKGGPVTL